MIMRTKLFILSISVAMLSFLACNDDIRNTDYINDFPLPSNLEILVDIAQDYSGNVKIIPTAQGVHFFEIDFGDGSDTEQLFPGAAVFKQYETGVYTLTVFAFSIEGASVEHRQEIQVLSRCQTEESSNENPSDGPLDITFMDGNGRFFPIGGIVASVVENPAFDFDNLSCYVHQFERKENCTSTSGAIKVLPTMLSVGQDEEKKLSMDVFAQDNTAEVTLYLVTSPPTEITQPISEIGRWEQLTFDLSSAQGKSFNRLLIYFDKGTTCDGSMFYFDNLKLID